MLSLMLETTLLPEYLCSFDIMLVLIKIFDGVISVHWIAATGYVLGINLYNLNAAILLASLVIHLASRSLHRWSLWSDFKRLRQVNDLLFLFLR